MADTWKTSLDGATEHRLEAYAMLHYVVASSLRVHGDSSQDGSERSLNGPENQCSIGFQPVFCSHVDYAFQAIDCGRGRVAGRGERLVYRLVNNGDVVAFKMGRRQGARRAHI